MIRTTPAPEDARPTVAGPVVGPSSLAYQPPIDGLRGLAVLAVLLFHAGHLDGGFLGVDLFFTVSGYLITSLLLAEHARSGRIGLGRFWGRRARRLLPALFVLIAAVLLFYAEWGAPGEDEQLRGPGLAGLFYVANWYTVVEGGYWDLFSAPSPLEHLWSLAIEEQFYLLWPFVVVLVLGRLRGNARTLGFVAAGAAAVSAVLMAWFASTDVERAYLGTDSRIGSILIGAVVAVALRHQDRRAPTPGSRALPILAGLAAAGLLAMWVTADGTAGSLLYRGGFTVHALLVAVVITAVTRRPTTAMARGLSWRPIVAVGLVSYGLYLWHWPVFVWLTPDRTGLVGWALTAVRFAVSFALAIASYHLIERPIRRGALRPRFAVPLAVAGAAVLAAAVVVVSRPPSEAVVTTAPLAPVGAAPPTVAPATTQASSTSAASAPSSTAPTTSTTSPTTPPSTAPVTTPPPPPISPLVHTVPPSPAQIRQPTPDDPLRVVLIGDSYMYDAAPGIEAGLEATGLAKVVDRSVLGFGVTMDGWDRTLVRAIDTERPDLVVTMWARYDVDWLSTHEPAEYAARLQEAAGLLLSSGAHLLVVGLAPSEVGYGMHDHVPRGINELFAGLPALFPGQVTYLDPDPVVAPSGQPTLAVPVPGGELRVRKVDLSHYCPDGAARFGQALIDLLAVTAAVPAPATDWYAGRWREEGRYDNPPGSCR
ncbi:MAG TPA: acyltransferase family protein [Acidimicrobiales bacterium]|nr:acyltransferase family protein [Acidimicrobiales bacterium]